MTWRNQAIPAGLAGQIRRTISGTHFVSDNRQTCLEFDLVMRGSGSYLLGHREFALKPGMLMWLVPDTHHRLTRSTNLEMWVVNVRPDLLDTAWVAELAAEPSHLLSGHELFDLDRLLAQIAQDSDEPAVYNAGIAYLTLRAWRASHETPPEIRPPMHPAVTRALMLLRERQEETSLAGSQRRRG
jgi:hypothetical protein